MASTSSGGQVGTVWVRRARHRAEPFVEEEEVLDQAGENGDIFRLVEVNNLMKLGCVCRC